MAHQNMLAYTLTLPIIRISVTRHSPRPAPRHSSICTTQTQSARLMPGALCFKTGIIICAFERNRMKRKQIYFILTSLATVALTLTSCGASNNSSIATSVALTVQAQNTQAASLTTETPVPLATGLPLADTPTEISTLLSPTAPP